MKAQVLTLTGAVDHEIDLPQVFGSEYRPDLIKKSSYLPAEQEISATWS